MTTNTLKQTILHDVHVALGAKMVDFGGWHMPIQYTSQIEEHSAVRSDIGMFDVSHMRIVDLHGNVKPFLQYLIANDVEKLKNVGKALYSCMLNENGGIIDDLIVYYFADDYYRLVINAGCTDKDLAWISKINQEHAFNLEIKPRTDLAMIAVQGPNAINLFTDEIKALKPFNAHIDNNSDIVIARTGYTGEDGVEIMLPLNQAITKWTELLAQGAKPCGLGARDTLRLEAGMNLYGQDMNEEAFPQDSGLAWTLSISDNRNFIGKDKITSTAPKYQFLGLVLETGGVLRAHQIVVDENGNKGEITSGGYSPTMQKSIAMAKLPIDIKVGDTVNVQIRDKYLSAKVVKLPFVRNGKVLV
jgi:aminomethyltransferase